ncbi:MAG: SRPBCC family protein [Planctomycetota bacterium]
MIELHSHFQGSVEVTASPEDAFALVADVYESSRHVSGLESVVRYDDGWRWVTRKVGAGKVSLYVDYACRYAPDPEQKTLRWTPIPGVGNSELRGTWTIVAAPSGARLTLDNDLVLRMGIPRLLKKPAEVLFARENTRILEGYLVNLKTTLDGGDGRRR